MRRSLVALALVACSSRGGDRSPTERPPGPSAPSTSEVVETRQCGEVVATWRGHRVEGRRDLESLTFTVPGEAAPLPWTHGDLDPPHWSLDVFAPDCGHVLLWWSHTGPYHVVATARLGAYLRGAPPDHELRGRDGDSAPVFDGAWVDARTIRYRSGCCDPPIDLQFTVP